jgi:hypothetical protein
MVGLYILLALPFLVIGMVMAVGAILWFVPLSRSAFTGAPPPISATSLVAFPLLFACLACVLTLLSLVVLFIRPFAARGLVLGNLGVMDSIRHGWQVLRRNLANILILAVIFLIIGIIVGLIGLFVAGLLAVPFVVPAFLGLMRGTGVTLPTILLAAAGALVFILITAVINSVLVTYQSTTFTLAYQGFVGEKQPEALPG